MARQAFRQRHKPLCLDPRLLRVATPPSFTNPPAGQDDFVTGLVSRIVRAFDCPGKVNARHMRIVPHQTAALGPQTKPVLIVQGGILNRNGNIAALGQLIVREGLNRCLGEPVFVLGQKECMEGHGISFFTVGSGISSRGKDLSAQGPESGGGASRSQPLRGYRTRHAQVNRRPCRRSAIASTLAPLRGRGWCLRAF